MRRQELIDRVIREGERCYSSPYIEAFCLTYGNREFRVVIQKASGGRVLPPILQEKRDGEWRRVLTEEIEL